MIWIRIRIQNRIHSSHPFSAALYEFFSISQIGVLFLTQLENLWAQVAASIHNLKPSGEQLQRPWAIDIFFLIDCL